MTKLQHSNKVEVERNKTFFAFLPEDVNSCPINVIMRRPHAASFSDKDDQSGNHCSNSQLIKQMGMLNRMKKVNWGDQGTVRTYFSKLVCRENIT